MCYIVSALSLDYYDGGTQGLALASDGSEHVFSTLWSSWSVQVKWLGELSSLRVFLLEEVTPKSFATMAELIGKYEQLNQYDEVEHVVLLEGMSIDEKTRVSSQLDETLEAIRKCTIRERVLLANSIVGQRQIISNASELMPLLLGSRSLSEGSLAAAWSAILEQLARE